MLKVTWEVVGPGNNNNSISNNSTDNSNSNIVVNVYDVASLHTFIQFISRLQNSDCHLPTLRPS